MYYTYVNENKNLNNSTIQKQLQGSKYASVMYYAYTSSI